MQTTPNPAPHVVDLGTVTHRLREANARLRAATPETMPAALEAVRDANGYAASVYERAVAQYAHLAERVAEIDTSNVDLSAVERAVADNGVYLRESRANLLEVAGRLKGEA